MPSELGRLISGTRQDLEMSLRGLAREIQKSPSFVVMIEKSDPAPAMAEETLRRIATVLNLDPDRLLTLAGRTPHDVVPSNETEVAIYRLVKRLPEVEKQRLLRRLLRKRD